MGLGCAMVATPDGNYVLHSEAQAEIDALKAAQQWRPIESAPKDGSAVRLLINGGDFPLIDADTWETIGNFGVGEDQSAWTFAGWCWTHDEYRTGNGEVIGWLPLTTPAIAKARGES